MILTINPKILQLNQMEFHLVFEEFVLANLRLSALF